MSTGTEAPGEQYAPSLALANSRMPSSRDCTDFLGTPESAHQWLTARGLLPQDAAIPDEDIVRRLRELRSVVRELFDALAQDRRPDPASVRSVNTLAALDRITPHLSWTDEGPRRNWQADLQGTEGALAALARDAIDLTVGPHAENLRRCGAHNCIRFFVREHARRRWCSTTCGDRVRAARHQERVVTERGADHFAG